VSVGAGARDRLIRLRRRVTGINRSGSERREPEDIGTEWAHKRAVSGREAFAAQTRYATVDAVFVIPYRSDVTPLHEIVDGGRTYDVQAVLEVPGGRPVELEILATARAE